MQSHKIINSTNKTITKMGNIIENGKLKIAEKETCKGQSIEVKNGVKALLILGEPGGEMLFNLEYLHHGGNVVAVDASKITNPYAFNLADNLTQIILIYNITNQNQLLYCYPMITTGVWINKKHKAPFIIHPKLILLSTNLKPSDLPSDQFDTLFEVIDLTRKGKSIVAQAIEKINKSNNTVSVK